jgi:hypothetical protein
MSWGETLHLKTVPINPRVARYCVAAIAGVANMALFALIPIDARPQEEATSKNIPTIVRDLPPIDDPVVYFPISKSVPRDVGSFVNMPDLRYWRDVQRRYGLNVALYQYHANTFDNPDRQPELKVMHTEGLRGKFLPILGHTALASDSVSAFYGERLSYNYRVEVEEPGHLFYSAWALIAKPEVPGSDFSMRGLIPMTVGDRDYAVNSAPIASRTLLQW